MGRLVSKKIINSEPVYDLCVKKNHNFYANGLLVHNCGNSQSVQGNNLLKLKAKYKIGTTGTLITNSALSCYGPLKFTENDMATLTNYKAQYCNFGGFNNSQIIGYKNLDLLQDELDGCSIRRTFEMVRGDMPKKTIEYETVEMSDEHAKFYEAIKNGVKEEADKINLNANNLLALTTRLRQATAAPSVLTTQDITSSKVERAVELAEEILESKEKVVLFCNFIETANKLKDLLIKFNPIICTGNQTEDEIKDGVEKFRISSNYNLLIGSHSKMGTGFSFPEAHYMIVVDTPFTWSQFSQSVDRIYRITSQQPIFVKVLVCKDTIDERVQQIVEAKKDLSDYVIDDIENESFSNTLRDIISNL